MSNITINGLTAVHAGSGGVVKSPDVCKVGSKCRPVTFSNTARSADARQTASTVTINGHPACTLDSILVRSYGDEPGNCGGIRSGTVAGKAEFITASPNVFYEGRPAVRESDLVTSNNRNTPPMPIMQPGAPQPATAGLVGASALAASKAPRLVTVSIYGAGEVDSNILVGARPQGGEGLRQHVAPAGGPCDEPSCRVVVLPSEQAGLQELELLVPREDAWEDEDPWIRLPLGLARDLARADYEAGARSPVMLVPLLPARYTDGGRSRDQARPLAEGWVYVFVNGRLWRELEVVGEGWFADVDLAAGEGQDVRTASGIRDRLVLVPHRVGDRDHEVHLAYSRVQWSWERIRRYSGWTVGPMNARQQRFAHVDLARHEQDFPDRGDGLCLADALPDAPLFAIHRGTKVPAQCLDDPLGVAWQLKDAHLDAVARARLVAARIEQEDGRLARVIRSLLVAEKRAVQAAAAAGREPPPEVVSGSINREKLEHRLQYWDEEVRAADNARDEAEARLVAWLRRERGSGGVAFSWAMAEFLEDNIPERRMQGVAIVAELLEHLFTRDGRDYLRELVTERDAAGLGRALCNPDEATAQVALRMETGDYHPHGVPDGRHLARDAATAVARYTTKVVSSLVSSLANATREADLEHFDWVRKLVARYLPELEVKVATAPLASLWFTAGLEESQLYRYLPRPGDLEKRIRVKYLYLPETDVRRSAKALQDSLVYRRGFGALVAALECINFASAMAQAARALDEDQPRYVQLAGALLTGLAAVSRLAEQALGESEKILESRFAVLVNEYRREEGRRLKQLRKSQQEENVFRETVRGINGLRYEEKATSTAATLSRARETAGHASRILGHLAAWVDVGRKLHNLERLLRTGKGEGAFWQALQLGAQGLSAAGFAAMGLSRVSRFELLVSRLLKAAGVARMAGAAGSVTGVGLAVFLVSLALEHAAGLMLEKFQESALERVLRYGFFGRNPYEKNFLGSAYGPHEEPAFRERPAEAVGYPAPEGREAGMVKEHRPWRAGVELAPLYGVLFHFRLEAEMLYLSEKVELNPGSPRILGHVLWGRVRFSRFLPRRGFFEPVFRYRVPGEAGLRLVLLEDMVVVEHARGGAVEAVEFYKAVGPVGPEWFAFTGWMDVHGDGVFRVPEDGCPRKVRVDAVTTHDPTNVALALRRIRTRLSPGKLRDLRVRDLGRRVLRLMDRVASGEDMDLAGELGGLRRRFRDVVERRQALREDLERLPAAAPGSEAWEALEWRFEARAKGEHLE